MKMIKVGRENLNYSTDCITDNINAISGIPKNADHNSETQPFLNFYTPDFLGILSSSQNLSTPNEETFQIKILENLIKIFRNRILLFSDEKNAHQKILNRVVAETDIVVVDKLAGKNIQIAAEILKYKGTKVKTISHNNTNELEEILQNSSIQEYKVWYLVQGIYPTPGTKLPVDSIKQMLKKFPGFYLYADDTDGLGWYGNNGRGFICDSFEGLEKIIVASSLIKGFGAQGGVVLTTGAKNIKIANEEPQFSLQTKPLYESILQASEVLLSGKLKELQTQLKLNIDFFHTLLESYSLPVVSDCNLPVIYIAAGRPGLCEEICSEALKEGLFVSSAYYPEIPLQCSGIKINITVNYTGTELKKLASVLSSIYYSVLKKKKLTTINILETFRKNITRI